MGRRKMGRREENIWMRRKHSGQAQQRCRAYLPTRPESLLGHCMETKHAKTATLSLTLLGGRERHWEGDIRVLQMQQGKLIFLIKKKNTPVSFPMFTI